MQFWDDSISQKNGDYYLDLVGKLNFPASFLREQHPDCWLQIERNWNALADYDKKETRVFLKILDESKNRPPTVQRRIVVRRLDHLLYNLERI